MRVVVIGAERSLGLTAVAAVVGGSGSAACRGREASGASPAAPAFRGRRRQRGHARTGSRRSALRVEPGRGRTAVPVRSASAGSVIAVAVVTTTLTFGAGLHTLVQRLPACTAGTGTLGCRRRRRPAVRGLHLLDSDPAVEGYAGYQDLHAQLDGQEVPVLLGEPNANVAPPVLSGHQLAADNQIVLGAAYACPACTSMWATRSSAASERQPNPFLRTRRPRSTIVGTATLPAVVGSGSFADHTTMGTGAILSSDFLPKARTPAPTRSPVDRRSSSCACVPAPAPPRAWPRSRRSPTLGNRVFAPDSEHARARRSTILPCSTPRRS